MKFLESLYFFFQRKKINVLVKDETHENFFFTDTAYIFQNNLFFKGENVGSVSYFNSVFIFQKKYYCIRKIDKKITSYNFDLEKEKKINLKSVIMTAISSLDNNYKNIFLDMSMLKSWGLILPIILFLTFISFIIVISNVVSMLNLSNVQGFINIIFEDLKEVI